jgi:hypothetical protein
MEGSDYVVMRDGVDPKSNYLLIDAGIARQKPDHTHGGVLGIIAMSHGMLFLPNYPVRYSDPQYIHLKNSYAKSVAIADSLPQARGWIGNAARTGFGKWSFIPTPVITAWITTPEYDFLSASHNGFDSIGVSYNRAIFFKKGKYWIVIDDFRSSTEHSYQQIWQGDFSTDPRTNSTVATIGDSQLHLYQLNDVSSVIKKSVAGYYPSTWFYKTDAKNFQYITVLYPTGTRDSAVPVFKKITVRGSEGISVTIGDVVDTVVIRSNDVQFATQRSMR